MPKQKINLKSVLADIRSGSSDAELREKYVLSVKGLEFVFNKLVELKALTPEDVSGRVGADSKLGPFIPSAAGVREQQHGEQPEIDPQLAQTAAELVRAGSHDSELMVKMALKPSQLQQLLEDLVRLGYVTAEELDGRGPKKTRRCQSCGALMAEEDTRCKNCSPDPNAPLPDMPDGRPGGEAPHKLTEESYDEKYCAWDDRASQGTMKAYLETATKCLLSPAHFFSTLPLEAGYGAPILFGVMSMVFGAVFTYLWVHILRGGLSGVSVLGLIIITGFAFIGSVIVVPISLLLWSLITHGMLLLLKGARSGFEATLRVVSYSSVTAVFSAVPVVGTIASLWALYLGTVGLRETHETDTAKAAAAVLIPPAVLVLLGLVLASGSSHSPSVRLSKPAQNLCGTLQHFVNRVDSAIATGRPAAAEEEIKAALVELDQTLKGFKRLPNVDRLKEKAVRFAVTSLTTLALTTQLGEAPGSGQLLEKVSEFRASILEECRQ
jgi:hypothetical protein